VWRLTVLLRCIAIAAAGCVHAAATMTPGVDAPSPSSSAMRPVSGQPGGTPSAVIPSKACGGYHLVVENAASSDISVIFNEQPVITIQPGRTADIAQRGIYPVPLMPWDVEARRVADGVVLLQMHLEDDGTGGQRVRVEDTPDQLAAVSLYIC
jgi:hypothetical protein